MGAVVKYEMMHKIGMCVLCVGLVGAMMQGARSDQVGPTTPIPDIVNRAATVYSAETRGVVGLQRHFTTVVRAGPIRHTEHSDSGFLMNDGSYTRIKYYQIADDGRPFTADQIGARDSQTNHDWSAGKIFFKEPYDPRFLGDYQFEVLDPCPTCTPDTAVVNFTSDIHDAQHGSGTMWIDAATAHVIKVKFTPNQLPPHATSGTVTETTSEVWPGVWYVTEIQAAYKGRLFLLTGSATFTATFDHFHRFERVSVGNDALDNGTI
jgi:hypothetical protein